MHRQTIARGATSSNNFQARDFTQTPPIVGTVISADILNAVQEELCNVIERMGVTLDSGNDQQLMDAIGQTWVVFKGITGSPNTIEVLASQNVSGVTRISDGSYEVFFDNDFYAGTYDVLCSFGSTSTSVNPDRVVYASVFTASSVIIRVMNNAGVAQHDNNMRISVRLSGRLA